MDNTAPSRPMTVEELIEANNALRLRIHELLGIINELTRASDKMHAASELARESVK